MLRLPGRGGGRSGPFGLRGGDWLGLVWQERSSCGSGLPESPWYRPPGRTSPGECGTPHDAGRVPGCSRVPVLYVPMRGRSDAAQVRG
ncbi:hypothetical protein DLE01_13400 [Streptomyces sp. FT05W]|nr:hypothetical protein DLE01_13400 [Streptomyces sp. FT05W]